MNSDLGSSLNWWVKHDGVLFHVEIGLLDTSWEPLSILIRVPLLSIEVLDLNGSQELIVTMELVSSLLVDELGDLPSLGVSSWENGSPHLRLSSLMSVLVNTESTIEPWVVPVAVVVGTELSLSVEVHDGSLWMLTIETLDLLHLLLGLSDDVLVVLHHLVGRAVLIIDSLLSDRVQGIGDLLEVLRRQGVVHAEDIVFGALLQVGVRVSFALVAKGETSKCKE